MELINLFEYFTSEEPCWSAWERKELARLKAGFGQDHSDPIWEDGATDRGEPWVVAIDEESNGLVIHLARFEGQYVALDSALTPISAGVNLRSVVNSCISQIKILRQDSSQADGTVIRMPAAVSYSALAAFVVDQMRGSDLRIIHGNNDMQTTEQTVHLTILDRLIISIGDPQKTQASVAEDQPQDEPTTNAVGFALEMARGNEQDKTIGSTDQLHPQGAATDHVLPVFALKPAREVGATSWEQDAAYKGPAYDPGYMQADQTSGQSAGSVNSTNAGTQDPTASAGGTSEAGCGGGESESGEATADNGTTAGPPASATTPIGDLNTDTNPSANEHPDTNHTGNGPAANTLQPPKESQKGPDQLQACALPESATKAGPDIAAVLSAVKLQEHGHDSFVFLQSEATPVPDQPMLHQQVEAHLHDLVQIVDDWTVSQPSQANTDAFILSASMPNPQDQLLPVVGDHPFA